MMLKISLPCGNILPKYFHLELSILAFFFFIITHSRKARRSVGKDNFPQANLSQSLLTPQGTVSPFTGKGRKQCHYT